MIYDWFDWKWNFVYVLVYQLSVAGLTRIFAIIYDSLYLYLWWIKIPIEVFMIGKEQWNSILTLYRLHSLFSWLFGVRIAVWVTDIFIVTFCFVVFHNGTFFLSGLSSPNTKFGTRMTKKFRGKVNKTEQKNSQKKCSKKSNFCLNFLISPGSVLHWWYLIISDNVKLNIPCKVSHENRFDKHLIVIRI